MCMHGASVARCVAARNGVSGDHPAASRMKYAVSEEGIDQTGCVSTEQNAAVSGLQRLLSVPNRQRVRVVPYGLRIIANSQRVEIPQDGALQLLPYIRISAPAEISRPKDTCAD